MGRLSEDLVLNTGFLNLGLKFFGIKMQLRKIKRKNYKLVAVKYPIFNEIIYSTNAFPLFVPRIPSITDFDILKKAISHSRLAENVFGKKIAEKGIGVVSDLLDSAILSQLNQIFKNFSYYVKFCEQSNFIDNCFGNKLFVGGASKNIDILDIALLLDTPCINTNESFKYISNLIDNVITIKIPENESYNETLNHIIEQINNFVSILESHAGPIDPEKIKNYTDQINKIKELIIDFYNFFKKDDFLPVAPDSFRFMLSMINSIYIDLISSPKYVLKNMQILNQHLIDQLNAGNGYEIKNKPRILIIPSLCGFEYSIGEYLAKKKIFLYYFDLIFYRLLEPIKNSTNWIKNQATFYLNFYNSWNSFDSLINEWIKLIKQFKIDGVIFNDLTGCNHLKFAVDQFKLKLDDLNIPIISIEFCHLNENLHEIFRKIDQLLEKIAK